MPKNMSRYYLFCQMAGWGLVLVVLCLMQPNAVAMKAIVVAVGLLASHGLRELIVRGDWLRLPVMMGLMRILSGIAVVCAVGAVLKWMMFVLVYGGIQYRGVLWIGGSLMQYIFLIFPWACIYCMVHYVNERQKDVLKVRQLEARLDELRKRGYI